MHNNDLPNNLLIVWRQIHTYVCYIHYLDNFTSK